MSPERSIPFSSPPDTAAAAPSAAALLVGRTTFPPPAPLRPSLPRPSRAWPTGE
jgi:hypothetical protein